MYETSQKYKDYISSPNRQFEVRAIIGGVVYGSNEVIEFTIDDMLTGGDELTLGTVIPAKLSIKIKTTNSIPTNAKVVPQLRLNGPDGYTEWIPMGEFYIDSRQYQNGVWTFNCVDKLITTEQPYISSLTYPIAMSEVFEEILDILGIESDVVINSTFQIPYKDESISIRDMLSCIASAHGANVKMNREGELIFVPLSHSSPVATITASNYIRAEQTNPQKAYTKLEVVHNTEGETLSRGTGNEDNTLKFENRFMFIEQSQFNNAFSVMNGFSYVPYTMTWTGRPDLDVGDVIKIVLLDSTEITSIIAVNKISFKGGILQQSSAPSKSEQQSEFRFQGTISKQLAQKLTKDAIYNGVSFGPTYGLKVERSDGKVRLLANATEGIRIQKSAGGDNWEDVIFLDAQGNGNFTGKVVSSQFEGGSIDIGDGQFTVDSEGNVFSNSMTVTGGSVVITRDDNKARVTISGADGFKIQKGDGTGEVWEDVIYIDAEGNANFTGIITGGMIRTSASGRRIEISENQIRHYNDTNVLQGLSTNNQNANFGDVEFYDEGTLVFRIYNNLGNGVALTPENGKVLQIGGYNKDTYAWGNWTGVIQNIAQEAADEKEDWLLDQLVIINNTLKRWDGEKLVPVGAVQSSVIYEATILQNSWEGINAPYYQDVSVAGITEDDNPLVDVKLTGIYVSDLKILDEWQYIYRILTYDGYIRVYAHNILTVDIPIQLKGVG